MVISFSFFIAVSATLHLQIIRVRLLRVKAFIGPHNCYHVCITKVFNVMGIAGGYINVFQLITTNVIFYDFTRNELSEAADRRASYLSATFLFIVVPLSPGH